MKLKDLIPFIPSMQIFLETHTYNPKLDHIFNTFIDNNKLPDYSEIKSFTARTILHQILRFPQTEPSNPKVFLEEVYSYAILDLDHVITWKDAVEFINSSEMRRWQCSQCCTNSRTFSEQGLRDHCRSVHQK